MPQKTQLRQLRAAPCSNRVRNRRLAMADDATPGRTLDLEAAPAGAFALEEDLDSFALDWHSHSRHRDVPSAAVRPTLHLTRGKPRSGRIGGGKDLW